jgi:hypothetical protein
VSGPKRRAAASLIGGLALALATPAYVATVAPYTAPYLLHPVIFVIQALPYVACAGLWLPWSSSWTDRPALFAGVALFGASLAVYVPMMWTAGGNGGDMMALGYLAVSAALMLGVLVASGAAWLILRHRAHRAAPAR